MGLPTSVCLDLLEQSRFGVLGTVDARIGIHQVPVVFVTNRTDLVIPIDTIKPKTGKQLRRIINLDHEPRASLLVDHRNEDWNQLWWVRVDLVHTATLRPDDGWAAALRNKYKQYDRPGSVNSLLVFTVGACRGWAASEGPVLP